MTGEGRGPLAADRLAWRARSETDIIASGFAFWCLGEAEMTAAPDYLRSLTCWTLFFGSLFATAALTPLVMLLARRLGAVDSGGHRKIYEGSMPLLGGLALLIPFVGFCLLASLGRIGLFGQTESMRTEFLMIGLGGIAIAALGVFDDIHGLRARYKLIAQIVIALGVVAAGPTLKLVELPLVGLIHLSPVAGALVGTVWVVGLINAINIIDGVDGLAAGISLIAALGLAVLAALGPYPFMLLTSVALAGSLAGFLPFNFNPAKIFLGDTGSMFLGFALAMITLMGAHKAETAVIVIAPLLALGFPIFEAVLSMTRRLVRGAPIFGADDLHTHHRLLSRGYSQRKVVLLLYGVSAILTSMAVVSRILPSGSPWEWLSPAIGGATLVGIVWLAGYLRTVRVDEVLQKRQRTALRHAYAQYAALSLGVDPSAEKRKRLLELGLVELGLQYLSLSWPRGEVTLATNGDRPVPAAPQRLRVKTTQGEDVAIEYEFAAPPDDEGRRDVAACLARMIEQGRLD